MRTKNNLLPFILLVFLSSCNEQQVADAYGNFIADEVMVSAKGTGELKHFLIKEGTAIADGETAGLIDTTQLYLQKAKTVAQLRSLTLKLQEAEPEIAVLLQEKQNITRERNRTASLLENKAATPQQLDDYNGKLDQVNQQINAVRSQVNIKNRGILAEREPLSAQIDLLNQQIKDNTITNPLAGTVIAKFASEGELVSQGTPLYQVADLQVLTLRAYISATDLGRVRLNDQVTVRVDDGPDEYTEMSGTVSFIASKAEFTPKTIQTKEERVQLVYAMEVKVQNNGSLKIGMPAEVILDKTSH